MGTNNPGGAVITPKHPDTRNTEILAERAAIRPQAMFKIQEIAPGAATPTIDFVSIPQTFRHLKLFASLRADTAATAFSGVILNLNNDAADANYFREESRTNAAAGQVTNEFLGNAGSRTIALIPAANAPAGHFGQLEITIADFASATKIKQVEIRMTAAWGTATSNVQTRTTGLFRNSQEAINRLTFGLSAGNFLPGSVISLYGAEAPF